MTGLDQAFNSGVILSGGVSKTDSKWEKIGILFDYIQDETSTVEADITDNWVESNYTLQDHIAIKPRIYRIRGCVGEVLYENIYRAIDKYEDFKANHSVFNKTVDTINNIASLSGFVSNYTRAAINVVKQIESSFDRYKKVFDNFTKANQIRGKRQAVLYEILVYMMQNRVPVKLTKLAFGEEIIPEFYTYDKNYFIQSVSAHQGDNAFISDIEVTIKEIRVAVTKTTKVDSKKFGGYAATQKTEQASNGLAKGENIKTSTGSTASVGDILKKAETITQGPPRNPIKKFFWNIEQKMGNAYENRITKNLYGKK